MSDTTTMDPDDQPTAPPGDEATELRPPPGPAGQKFSAGRRMLAIATPLGEDAVHLRALRGEEAVSRLFHFELELEFSDSSTDAQALLGKGVTALLKLPGNEARFFNGLICRIAQAPTEKKPNIHRASLVPWTWLLTRSTNCRIFQNLTVPAIVERVFAERGLADYQLRLRTPQPVREYCVQYRETDYNFIARLLEDAGIWFMFEHENGKHVMVLGDSPAEHRPLAVKPQARFSQSQGRGSSQLDVVTGWAISHELRPSRYSLASFNFETPGSQLGVSIDSVHESPVGARPEVYDYPGRYDTRGDGESMVRTRIEEEEAQALVIRGSGTCRTFVAGCRFELTDHPTKEQNQAYALTAVHHEASEPTLRSGADSDDGPAYSNEFVCLPAQVPFRPRRGTPRPVIHGAQTAIVVGKDGEEIWVDQHGRVKVQFHWDRQGQRNEQSSCWVRVAQSWAGKRWGTMFLPRVGQEVLVEFLEGDPDCPVVTGSLYNGEQTPPYDLPAEQTKGAIKSASSKGGGGFNELRFDDKKGGEQIFLHGERDLDLLVKRDAREWVGGDRHLIVTRSRVERVDHESHLKVGGNAVQEIGGVLVVRTSKNVVIEAAGGVTLKAGGGFVQVDQSGVVIQGTLVNINSGGTAATASGVTLRSPDKASSSGASGSTEPPTEPSPEQPPDYALVVAYYEDLLKEHGPAMTPEDRAAAEASLEDLRAAAARNDKDAVLTSSQKIHTLLEKTTGKPVPPPPGFKAAGVDKDGRTILAPAETTAPDPVVGPTGSSALAPLKDQLRVVRTGDDRMVFADITGPRAVVFCHFMEGFSAYCRRPSAVVAQLDVIKAAGYQGTRFLDVLGFHAERGGGLYWEGREVTPVSFTATNGKRIDATPGYYEKLKEWLLAHKARGLKVHWSRGDCNALTGDQRRAHVRECARLAGEVGIDVVGIWEGLNEAWQNGARDAGECYRHYVEPFTQGTLKGISCPESSSEDKARLLEWSPNVPAAMVHGLRNGNHDDLIRHIFSVMHEGMRGTGKAVWQGEPTGPGSDVSVGVVNDVRTLVLMACMAVVSGQAWNYMSGHGVRWKGQLESQPGFREVPAAVAKLEAFFPGFPGKRLNHGGTGRENVVEVNARSPGDVRCDQVFDSKKLIGVAYANKGTARFFVNQGGRFQIIDAKAWSIAGELTLSKGQEFEVPSEGRIILGELT